MRGARTWQPLFYRRSVPGRKRFGAAFVWLLTLIAGQSLFGQATGSISGTITDASGSAVPGAKVTVTAPATGLTRSSLANESGEYLIPSLRAADYSVQVEQKGFQNATAPDIRLQVDEHRELDFKLFPASVQTSVEVSATPVAVQTSDPTLGQVITTQQVADLPKRADILLEETRDVPPEYLSHRLGGQLQGERIARVPFNKCGPVSL